ncbi:hypothetical protein BDR07DRAFT_1417841 [Suillus spraguei]|nr:hypothetical protein BDR07DRAFT_1417841 [Suillus spraguei]
MAGYKLGGVLFICLVLRCDSGEKISHQYLLRTAHLSLVCWHLTRRSCQNYHQQPGLYNIPFTDMFVVSVNLPFL